MRRWRPTNGEHVAGGADRNEGGGKCIARAARRRFASSREAVDASTTSSSDGKIFAHFRAIGLVRREIGRPSGKFFLACVQAVGARVGRVPVRAPSWRRCCPRNAAKKKKRVLPMFFFKPMSVRQIRRGRSSCAAAVVAAFRCRPGMTAKEKKLLEGVDTLKNRD